MQGNYGNILVKQTRALVLAIRHTPSLWLVVFLHHEWYHLKLLLLGVGCLQPAVHRLFVRQAIDASALAHTMLAPSMRSNVELIKFT